MDWQGALTFIHILLLVFWLGTDVGVFVLGKFAQNPAYSVDQRLLLLKVALVLDMCPRVCVVLIVPSGYQMAINMGAIDPIPAVSAGVWAISLVWLGVVVVGLARAEQPAGLAAKKAEKLLQILLIMALGWAGTASLLYGAPIAASWLAVKILMFVAIIIFMLLLEKAFEPAVIGFMRLENEGSSPDLEQQIRGAMDRTYLWVLAIYAAVVISAYLGVLQPGL